MKKYIPRLARLSFLIFALSALLYALCLNSVRLSDIVNSTASVGVRYVLANLTYPLPFSLFEALIILSPLLLILLVTVFVRRGTDASQKVRSLVSLLAVISVILTSYIFTLGVGYHTTVLSKRIGIEDKRDISSEELYYTTGVVLAELNNLAEQLEITENETRMPYSVDEMSERLVSAYDAFLENYPILTNYTSRVKPVYFSTVMSDLGISGIYSFFTGEANVNVEYPDYCLPFTAAHEMAHQRGVGRENEANFVAFLVCISSDDDYIRYSGYLNMYEYLASALYRASPELYYEVSASVHTSARADIRAANAVYNLHKDSILGKINDRLNDAYLKANGTEGVVSYGYVVRLAVGYYASDKSQ